MKADGAYHYVRCAYGVPAYIGVPVSVKGRRGVLVMPRRDDQYVYVRFENETKATGPFHPTDCIEYGVIPRLAYDDGTKVPR